MQEFLRSGYIQAKLAISNPDDPEEREANQVANTIMRKAAGAPSSSPCSCSHDGEICEECQQKQSQPTISRRASVPSAPSHISRIVSDVLRSPGHPLDASARAFFEPRFNHDFSGVRVYAGEQATESAKSIEALAYTAGANIVFGSGRYDPDSETGRGLLAHELTHVVQQGGAPARGGGPSAAQSFDPSGAVPRSRISHLGVGQTIMRQPVPQQQRPAYLKPEDFTLVKTNKLNAEGPYTKSLLWWISFSWKKTNGSELVAQRVVDALESSDYFVKIAAELDAHYSKNPDPKFAFKASLLGTYYSEDEPRRFHPDDDFINLDFRRSGITGPDEVQIGAFVSGVIHESTHAFDRIKRITKGGLSGGLEEEQRARKGELKGLEQVRAGTKDAALASDIDNRIAALKFGHLKKKDIAYDLISDGHFTYLENFFIGQATSEFYSQVAKAKNALGSQSTEITRTLKDIDTFHDLDYPLFVANVQYIVAMNSALDSEKPSGKPFPISPAVKRTLLRLLNTPMTLRELTDVPRPKMSNEERLLFFQILLLRAYFISVQIRDGWEQYSRNLDFTLQPGIAEKNARDFLGRPGIYGQIKD